MDLISLALCTLCIIVISRVLSLVYYQYVTRQRLKNIPQVDRFPFGSAFALMNRPDHERTKFYLKYIEKTYKQGIFIMWMFGNPGIVVYKPEYLELILPSTVNITKGFPYFLLKSWLGNGLLLSTGKQWFHDRRLIGPTFHFSILDEFAVLLSEKAEILIKCLERKIETDPGKAIDIFPFILNATLDIICETAMGVDIRCQEIVSKYSSTIHEIAELLAKRLYRPWFWINWLYYLTSTGKQYKLALDTLHGFTKEVIRKKMVERQLQNGNKTKPEDEDNESDIGKRKRKAFLDLLLDQNEKDDAPLTDDELKAQVDTFMFEGHDTTTSAISWTLFLLGNNFEHQEKVHEELEKVFGNSEIPASVKELSQLKYLDRVIKETLRIFPSVPTITRVLTEDVKLDNNILSKDENVLIPIIFVHRNPEVWPDPLKFDPDRFLPENSKHRNPYAYVPFSAGPRNCIGQKFALLEEKIVLTAILRKWRIKSVKTIDTIEYGGALTLRPMEEMLIHFTPKK
ncbi:cytochrome P450 4C1 isoform X2 [Solenopsis invicta]|nr:cytochrome P450 4C1 isoform X2 [Solenopsis invicta]XP_025987299.2 cytochrome P450 4C1 isoform X2 [Solenopsis invicta]XP_025987300.2 cytochrome P450 4C1 isoform X2 [Solenopsis invicta]